MAQHTNMFEYVIYLERAASSSIVQRSSSVSIQWRHILLSPLVVNQQLQCSQAIIVCRNMHRRDLVVILIENTKLRIQEPLNDIQRWLFVIDEACRKFECSMQAATVRTVLQPVTVNEP
jgi:hypothetical protein